MLWETFQLFFQAEYFEPQELEKKVFFHSLCIADCLITSKSLFQWRKNRFQLTVQA